MVEELIRQAGFGPAPTHVLIPGGVGGLAAAVAGHYWETLGPGRPRMVTVEPFAADCIFQSLKRGTPAPAEGDIDTFMACLAAGEVSPAAWPILRRAIDDAIAIPDAAAQDAMRILARSPWQDPRVASGESGCAGIAGLIAAAHDPAVRSALGLDPSEVENAPRERSGASVV
jgi:diaminopropionate ammonia-lyase